MNKKLLAQVALILLILIILLSFFFTYFKKESFIEQKQTNSNNEKSVISDDEKGSLSGIEYTSKDVNGNIYNIKAVNGKIDEKNPDLINLFNVSAYLIFDNKQKITVISDLALYNSNNFDTIFSKNVILNYDKHNISCGKIAAIFSENTAILSKSLIYDNFLTKLYADQMKIDLITRNSEITMFNQKKKNKNYS